MSENGAAVRWCVAAAFALACVGWPAGQAWAQSDEAFDGFDFGNETQAFVLTGLTTGGSFGSLGGGYYLGGEVSAAWLFEGVWGGVYADAAYDFGQGATTVSLGPEVGWMVLGLDGGLAARFGRQPDPELGFHVRGMLALGLFSLYGRYGGWPGAGGVEHVGQVGITLKFPAWTSHQGRPVAP
jgi:hypothetical protein